MNSTIIATDSVAVRLLSENIILYGVGNELHRVIANEERSQYVGISCHGRIRGIVQGAGSTSDYVIIYGESEFKVIKWNKPFTFTTCLEGTVDDWISCGKLLDNANEFILLTMHSVVLRFSFSDNSYNLMETLLGFDTSTLYCSFLNGGTWEDLIVFGANAFGEVLAWKASDHELCKETGKNRAILHKRIRAHNGVVFSIFYDPVSNYLITTSDDRSIKFWKVTPEAEQEGTRCNIALQTTSFGHTARVFQGKIIYYDEKPFAVTVGEDSSFCIWQCNGKIVFRRNHQFGAPIWNFDYDPASQTLFTIGSNSNLLAYGLQEVLANRMKKDIRISFNNPDQPKEFVTKIRCLSKDIVIAVSNMNSLCWMNINKHQKWKPAIPEFKGYKCTVFVVYKQLIAYCGYKRMTILRQSGDIECKFGIVLDEHLLGGVIRAFQFLDETNYLISDELGNCLHLKVTDSMEKYPLELPSARERWLTAALKIDSEYLLVSNRSGNIMLYKFNQMDKYNLVSVVKHPHGFMGATLLQIQSSHDRFTYIKSASHDGTIKIIRLDKMTDQLRVVSRETVPLTWIEAIVPFRKEKDELLLGFNNSQCIAWTKRNSFIFELECGGGHRCWHYFIYSTKDNNNKDSYKDKKLTLVFLKQREVHVLSFDLYNKVKSKIQPVLRNQWHVRSCNVMCQLKNPVSEDVILISGGEDNHIKITLYDKLKRLTKLLTEIHSHISNIRCLKVLCSGNDCFIFSGGGRAQLCVTRLNLVTFQMEDLVNFSLKERNDANWLLHNIDPETRIMCLDVLRVSDQFYYIYLGCSDGYIRKLSLDEELHMTNIAEYYYGRCLLQLRLIQDRFLLAAGTEGSLRFLDINLDDKPLLEVELHKGGINALDYFYCEKTHLLHILCGGDNAQVTYAQFQSKDKPILASICNVYNGNTLESMHLSQVTGARLVSPPGEETLYSYTSGIDQKLLKCQVYPKPKTFTPQCFDSCVADIKGICVDDDQNCYLYGDGLQIHRF